MPLVKHSMCVLFLSVILIAVGRELKEQQRASIAKQIHQSVFLSGWHHIHFVLLSLFKFLSHSLTIIYYILYMFVCVYIRLLLNKTCPEEMFVTYPDLGLLYTLIKRSILRWNEYKQKFDYTTGCFKYSLVGITLHWNEEIIAKFNLNIICL